VYQSDFTSSFFDFIGYNFQLYAYCVKLVSKLRLLKLPGLSIMKASLRRHVKIEGVTFCTFIYFGCAFVAVVLFPRCCFAGRFVRANGLVYRFNV